MLREQEGFRYSTPIFNDKNGLVNYELVVSFPQKDRYVFSSIIGLGGLTFFLTLFIVFVSSSALYQIIHQKKISEIKTDFINNMSHEFKTPIATINLALDAISNPKSIVAPEKVAKYVIMIREENGRMLFSGGECITHFSVRTRVTKQFKDCPLIFMKLFRMPFILLI